MGTTGELACRPGTGAILGSSMCTHSSLHSSSMSIGSPSFERFLLLLLLLSVNTRKDDEEEAASGVSVNDGARAALVRDGVNADAGADVDVDVVRVIVCLDDAADDDDDGSTV